jgi:hypothetical protein
VPGNLRKVPGTSKQTELLDTWDMPGLDGVPGQHQTPLASIKYSGVIQGLSLQSGKEISAVLRDGLSQRPLVC